MKKAITISLFAEMLKNMKIVTIINLLFLSILLGCNSNTLTDNSLIGSIPEDRDNLENKETFEENLERILNVDKASLGMTIFELKEVYKTAKFIEEPVFLYGVDGESNGLEVVENNERLFFVWTLLGDNRIKGITILSPSIIIDSDISVGITLTEFLKKYPDCKLTIDLLDEGIESCYVKEKNYSVEFLTEPENRVGEYNLETSEAELIKIRRPEAKIDRISIH